MSAPIRRSPRYLPPDWTLPVLTAENRAFFTRGELTLQRCRTCQGIQHPPLDLCRHCGDLDLGYEAASGQGRISSYTAVHNAVDDRLDGTVPYNVVIVELDDHPGVMVVGNVVPSGDLVLEIAAPVRITFAEVRDEEAEEVLLLPQWELIGSDMQTPTGGRRSYGSS
jgi:uncharacterized OB-fold protein